MKPLGSCLKIVKFIGLNPESHIKNKNYWIVKWFYLSIMAYNVIPTTTFIFTYIHDVDKITQALPVYCENIFMGLKLASYSFGINNLHYIMMTIIKYAEKRIAKNQIKNLIVAEEKSTLLLKFYGVLVLSTIIMLAVVPASIQFALFLMGTATDETFKEPFNNVYFFNNSRRYVYQIFYTISSIATASVSFSLVSLDCLFCTIVLYILAIVDDLKDYIREINETFEEDQHKLHYHLESVVDFHNAIFKFIRRFEKTAGSAFSLQYLGSILIICAVIYQSLIIDDKTSLAKTLLYFCAGMCQLLMYCWYGNLITEKCAEISGTVYTLPWYDYPTSLKKSILIVIMRSQKKVILMGWGLLRGNLEGFMSVLNTTMSALAVLRSMK